MGRSGNPPAYPPFEPFEWVAFPLTPSVQKRPVIITGTEHTHSFWNFWKVPKP